MHFSDIKEYTYKKGGKSLFFCKNIKENQSVTGEKGETRNLTSRITFTLW